MRDAILSFGGLCVIMSLRDWNVVRKNINSIQKNAKKLVCDILDWITIGIRYLNKSYIGSPKSKYITQFYEKRTGKLKTICIEIGKCTTWHDNVVFKVYSFQFQYVFVYILFGPIVSLFHLPTRRQHSTDCRLYLCISEYSISFRYIKIFNCFYYSDFI